MATRSNNVFVKLQAIGADATARDIDKVRKSLDDLSKARKDATTVDQDANAQQRDLLKSTRAMNTALKRQKTMMDNLRGSQRQYIQNGKVLGNMADKQTTRAIKNQKRLLEIQSMTRAEERAIRREKISAEKAKRVAVEKTLRAEQKRIREVQKAEQVVVRERKKALSGLAGLPAFRRPFRVAMILSITTLVADALSFVGTGINALGAGAIAGVNGLAPLTGMLITIPALFTTMAQSIVPATWGVKNFVNAWKGDKDSLKDAGKNTIALSKAIKKLKPDFAKLQKSVGERFIQGFDKSFGTLATVYLPILRKRLNGTAAAFNSVLTAGMKWFSSARGQSVVDVVMGTNNAIIRGGGGGVLNLLKGVGGLMKAASPMLRQASGEFQAWTNELQKKIFANQKGLTGFFNRSYKTFKGVTGTLGDFGTGLYRVFKKSAPLTRWMGKGIKDAASNFMIWAGSPGGQKAMTDYFREMKPNLKAIVGLAGDFGKTLFRISRSQNFKKTVDEIRTGLLPALEKIIKAADGKFIPNLVKFAESLAKLADAGVIDALADLGSDLADAFDWIATKFSALPDGLQSAIVKALVLVGLFGGIAAAIGGWVINLAKFLALLGKSPGIGRGFFGGAGGRGGAAGGAAGGGGILGGGGGSGGKGGSKAGKKTGSGGGRFIASGDIGGKKGNQVVKPSTKKPKTPKTPKPAKAPKGPGMAGGAAGGALLGLIAAGPIADAVGGVNKSMAQMEFRSQGAFQTMANGSKDASTSLNGLFSDMGNPHWNSFGESLQKTANPTKWQSFRQGVQGVTAAISGGTAPLTVAQAKFEGMDTALTNMPAAQAATAFTQIKTQAQGLGVPMDKLVSLFPQYRDSLTGSLAANEKAAGGMHNAAIAAAVMGGRVGQADSNLDKLKDKKVKPTVDMTDKATPKAGSIEAKMKAIDASNPKPTINATDNASPKADSVKTKLNEVASTLVKPTMTATDNVTPKANTAKGALNGLNGTTSNTHINTTNEAPGAVAAAAGALNGLDGKTATTYIKTVRSVSEVKLGGASGGRGSGPGRWTGGMTNPGMNYTVGERGPEIGITRGGNMMLLGVGGQHGFSPSSPTAIIPAGATRDPFGGNYGQAPDWARKMLQGGIGRGHNGMRGSGGGEVFAPKIDVHVNNPTQNIDVKRAVKDALTDIQYDREGRR